MKRQEKLDASHSKGGGGVRGGVEEVKGFMKMLLHDNDVFKVLFKGM